MKVKDFKGFMSSKSGKLNEQFQNENLEGMSSGANPEMADQADQEEVSDQGEFSDQDVEEEEVTMDDLKAMIDDLEERLSALEPDQEPDQEGEEGEEGEEVADQEEADVEEA